MKINSQAPVSIPEEKFQLQILLSIVTSTCLGKELAWLK